MDSPDDVEKDLQTTKAQVNVDVDLRFKSAPPGTRTPNPLVKSRQFDLSSGDK
jgi:hypothetical protein